MTQRADFTRVRTTGRAKPGRFVILSTLEDPELDSIRTGFITTKRSGKAHERVLLRRWFRALVQENVPNFENPQRYLVTIARPGANKASYAELAKDWIQQARRLGLFAPTDKKQ
ncbi:ribonuclease P protein component [Luteolibacter pohnpeiensis]|uniref:Ribonuclease P protein component n=2 Tax=Luteolibacter pohnpeiensis TaxID=454153 RepID=A0A934S7B2_9BACT|nr:ribonuclease P protein component [Luteolibacter pohnpeiensis]